MKDNKIEFEKLGNELFEESEVIKFSELNKIKGGLQNSVPMTIGTAGGNGSATCVLGNEIPGVWCYSHGLLRLIH